MFYFVCKKSMEYKLNLSSLYDLYLPIIGQTATNLYVIMNNFLDAEAKLNKITINSNTICQQLNISLEKLNNAKDKLEAMGLISTYVSTNNNEDNIYIFVLHSCLSYEEFISNPKFKALLIKQLTPVNFELIEYKYSTDQKLSESIEITKSFDKVFDDVNINNLHNIDFEQLYLNIQKTTSLPITIDDQCKQIIENVYAKYQISLHDIEMVIYDSINELDGYLQTNANLLIQNFNKLFSNQVNISYVEIKRDFKLFYGQLNQAEEDKIIADYKMCNSELYLYSIFKRTLTKYEKDTIAYLRTKCHLKDEIINVLIDFSLNKTNGQLNKKYLIKCANSINGIGLIEIGQIINHFKKALLDKNVKFDEKVEANSLESI